MRTLRATLVAALLLPMTLGAQRRTYQSRPNGSVRAEAGGALVYGRPTGVFSGFVKQGFGIDAFFRWNLDPRGIMSLRADAGWLAYGRETMRVPLSSTIGGRILVDVTTSNNILNFGVGPQLTAPRGPIRPYVNASGGFGYFFTESSVEGSNNNNSSFANTTNYDDFTLAWAGGGGLLIPVGVRQDISIDIGVRYSGNGKVKYLRRGGIVDLPNGGVQITPIQSEANLLNFRVGISAAIR